MLCFALAAFLLGFATVPNIARPLLARREKPAASDAGAVMQSGALAVREHASAPSGSSTTAKRMLTGVTLACMAALCWALLDPLPCLLATFGFALMEVVLVCDLEARIIPWELSLILLALGVPFRAATDTSAELVAAVALALLLLALLSFCNAVSRWLHKSAAIGGGDFRLVPALCIFGGVHGSLLGMFACAALMGSIALVLLAMRWATPRSGIPLAPGLVLWFVVGVFSCALL